MIYTYNRKSLAFERVATRRVLLFAGVALSLIPTLSFNSIEAVTPERSLEVHTTRAPFSEGALVAKLKELNVRFPHVALAQAKIESGRYGSPIFRENNNLFGMKEARQRINLAAGTNRGHAYYNSWEDSVLDYAFWCATYGNKCKTEAEFLTLLSGYAEDPGYAGKLQSTIQRENLKEKF